MIDCYGREIFAYYIEYHCVGKDVKETMMIAFDQRGLESISGISMRRDNGTRFVCNTVEKFLSMMNIRHERILPKTPKDEAHIESFNSILEIEVISIFVFENFEEAKSSIGRHVDFYNKERLHSYAGYITLKEMNRKYVGGIQKS